jgi:hypothetical protein
MLVGIVASRRQGRASSGTACRSRSASKTVIAGWLPRKAVTEHRNTQSLAARGDGRRRTLWAGVVSAADLTETITSSDGRRSRDGHADALTGCSSRRSTPAPKGVTGFTSQTGQGVFGRAARVRRCDGRCRPGRQQQHDLADEAHGRARALGSPHGERAFARIKFDKLSDGNGSKSSA